MKLVVASRNTVMGPLTKSSTQILDINMRGSQFQNDVSVFIDETLAANIDDGTLQVGDPHVVIEVRKALLSGSEGM